jgi:hypothetical protein
LATIYILPWQGRDKRTMTLHTSAKQAGKFKGRVCGVTQRTDARKPGSLLKIEVTDDVYKYFLETLGTETGIRRDIKAFIKKAEHAITERRK